MPGCDPVLRPGCGFRHRLGTDARPVCVRPPPLLLICAVGPCQALQVGIVVARGPRGRGVPRTLVVIKRQWWRSVTRRAARRAEREALDRRRAGATCWAVRAGAHAYLGPRPGGVGCRAGDMMVMGSPASGKFRCGRSVFGGRPRERGGSSMRGAGRGASVDSRLGAHEPPHAGWSASSPSARSVWYARLSSLRASARHARLCPSRSAAWR